MRKTIILDARKQTLRPRVEFAEWSRTVDQRIAAGAHRGLINSPRAHFPMLVVRLMPAVYVDVPITIEVGEAAVCFGLHTSFVRYPEPLSTNGVLSAGVKHQIVSGVIDASAASQRRMCILWSESEATYVEPDGRTQNRDRAPKGGARMRGKMI